MERQNHAYEAMKKTPEELVIWVIEEALRRKYRDFSGDPGN
jgi:hypothetical protein